jgi:hypothetical protein
MASFQVDSIHIFTQNSIFQYQKVLPSQVRVVVVELVDGCCSCISDSTTNVSLTIFSGTFVFAGSCFKIGFRACRTANLITTTESNRRALNIAIIVFPQLFFSRSDAADDAKIEPSVARRRIHALHHLKTN